MATAFTDQGSATLTWPSSSSSEFDIQLEAIATDVAAMASVYERTPVTDMQLMRLSTGSPFEASGGYSRAVRANSLVAVSGTISPVNAAEDIADLDTYTQTQRALEAALDSAQQLGASRAMVTRSRMYLAPAASWEEAGRAHGIIFHDTPPANTTFFVHKLIPPGALVEVELEAVLDLGVENALR